VGFLQVVLEQPSRRVSVVVESKGLEGGTEDEERHVHDELACFLGLSRPDQLVAEVLKIILGIVKDPPKEPGE
jgi:hypothetical protein